MASKNLFWKLTHRCYPSLRDFLLLARIIKHDGRQEYPIGFLKNGFDRKNVREILENHGFEPAVCAWIDDAEILSMRKEDGKHQYHVRLFSDNELRGHYEYSPEGNLWGHLKGHVFKPADEHFREILKEVLV